MDMTTFLAVEGPAVGFKKAADIAEIRFWRPCPDSLDQSVELGHGSPLYGTAYSTMSATVVNPLSSYGINTGSFVDGSQAHYFGNGQLAAIAGLRRPDITCESRLELTPARRASLFWPTPRKSILSHKTSRSTPAHWSGSTLARASRVTLMAQYLGD